MKPLRLFRFSGNVTTTLMQDGGIRCSCGEYGRRNKCNHSDRVAQAVDESDTVFLDAGELQQIGAPRAQNAPRNVPIMQQFEYPSQSSPGLNYTVLLYADGSTSCNCRGWTQRVASDGSRSCKHTKQVEARVGNASKQLTTKVVKQMQQRADEIIATTKLIIPKTPITTAKPKQQDERPRRRFDFT